MFYLYLPSSYTYLYIILDPLDPDALRQIDRKSQHRSKPVSVERTTECGYSNVRSTGQSPTQTGGAQ